MLRNTTTKYHAFLLCFLLAAGGPISAQAETAEQFELMVINGYGSSAAVLEGNYEQAVKLATRNLRSGTPYERAVNATSLCVAHAKMANLEQAASACAEAVKVSSRVSDLRKINRVARNNRKVVRAFVHDAP